MSRLPVSVVEISDRAAATAEASMAEAVRRSTGSFLRTVPSGASCSREHLPKQSKVHIDYGIVEVELHRYRRCS